MDGLVTIHRDHVKLFSLTQSRWCVVQRPRCYQVKYHMVTEAQPQGSVILRSQEPGGEPLMLCAIPLLTTTSLLEGSQTRFPFWGEAQLQYHQRDLFMCWRNRERERATYRALRCNTCRMCMFHPEWYTFFCHTAFRAWFRHVENFWLTSVWKEEKINWLFFPWKDAGK